MRAWLLPVWERMVELPDGLPEGLALKLIHCLEDGLSTIDAGWLARIEAAQQANPRDARLRYLAGMACLKRQLWGKAQQLLTPSSIWLTDKPSRQRLAQLGPSWQNSGRQRSRCPRLEICRAAATLSSEGCNSPHTFSLPFSASTGTAKVCRTAMAPLPLTPLDPWC